MGIAGTEITHEIRSDRVAENLPLLPPPSNPMHRCPMGYLLLRIHADSPSLRRVIRHENVSSRLAWRTKKKNGECTWQGRILMTLRNVQDTPDLGLFRLFIVVQP